MEYSKSEKYLYAFIVALTIFIVGVQLGIAHGRELQRLGYYVYTIAN